jgi:hypothetical protein
MCPELLMAVLHESLLQPDQPLSFFSSALTMQDDPTE